MAEKYKEYKNVSLPEVNREVLQFWQKNHIFEKSISSREGKKSFVFYEGPPSANGMPGIHHVMARAIKDIFCRYKTLKGFQVKRKGGWDTHGLPVELQVEKELGITKEDIGTKISVEEYNQKCREAVMKYKSVWDDLTERIGYWVDLDNPYITFENDYIESCWSLLKKLHEKDLLYKGYTIQPYSPAAGTGLSSHELNQPGCYRDVKDTSIVAQFKIKNTENDYFLAWTTTPWTLSSNTCLVVGKNIDYVKIKTTNQYTHQPINVILAKKLVNKVFGNTYILESEFNPKNKKHKRKITYTIEEEFKGSELVGTAYEQLMPYVQPTENQENAFKVILGDFVTTDDGTGIVHAAPTFGADDFRVAQQNNVPAITVTDENGEVMPLVDKKGRFVKEVTDYPEYFVKAEYYPEEVQNAPDFKPTDVLIAIQLKEENKAFKVEKYEHSYPHCWRTDKPVLYYPLSSWFIRTTSLKSRLVELNNTINWKPKSTGEGRFGNWLENLVDWNLSRSRYWGTPLPIWRTEDNSEERCIGSISELQTEIEKAREAGFENPENVEDLHRPYVDNITLVSASGKPMFRETDLIDVWFDSGAMPYAQWHYPFENDDIFKESYPADFISEGVDQTRGWFFTLHALAGLIFDSVAFKNVVSTGLVLDEKGEKMSKRKGNVIDPFEALKEHGADPIRWYMMVNSNPWDNLKFSLTGLDEVKRRFFGTLKNTYGFFALYANLDNFQYQEAKIPVTERTESDRWIISKLNSLIKIVDEAYADYEPTKVARAIQDFTIDDLSNWYIRLNRKRFWKGDYGIDKMAAYQTLYECLETIAKLMSPIAPFYSEQIYQDLNAVSSKESAESIHLSLMPEVNEDEIDLQLEEKMTLAQNVSSLTHSLRKQQKIKVRQPLEKVLVPALNENTKTYLNEVAELIKTEVNVKAVEILEDDAGILVKKAKPNFRKLGQQFGKKMKLITPQINKMSQDDIKTLEQTGEFIIDLDGEKVTLTPEDVLITTQDIDGWLIAQEGSLTVALDITITDELRKEGIARDLVNRIQNLRKSKGLEVQDKIKVEIANAEPTVLQAIESHKDYICLETQAVILNFADNLTEADELEIDEFKFLVTITVEK